MTISYDQIADVLYITFAKPNANVIYLEVDGGILRLDEETNKVIGITIPFFQEKIESGEQMDLPGVGMLAFSELSKGLVAPSLPYGNRIGHSVFNSDLTRAFPEQSRKRRLGQTSPTRPSP